MKDDQRKPDEMVIYTRTGDKGRTNLYDMVSVYKDDPRVEAYGTIDELNAFIGLAKHEIADEGVIKLLHDVQRKLFDVGAELATVDTSILKVVITQEDVDGLETQIDHYLQFFETPTYFILPGENRPSAYLHVARTVCRRAERLIVKIIKQDPLNDNVLKYVNRLSDLLYTLSRYVESGFEKITF